MGYSWQYSQGKKSEGGWKSERRGGSTVRLKAPIHSGTTVEIVVVAFSALPRILGECSTIFRLHFFFFFEVEIGSHARIPLFRTGSERSGSAN